MAFWDNIFKGDDLYSDELSRYLYNDSSDDYDDMDDIDLTYDFDMDNDWDY